jgi:uncharacterized YccA/Bax inhibitor family protein
MKRTSNPALRDDTFYNSPYDGTYSTMTIKGTITRTLFLLLLVTASAVLIWENYTALYPFLLPAIVLGFVIGITTIIKPRWSPFTSPVYAVLEGVILGTVSAWMNIEYPGIVVQAVTLTIGVFFLLLIVFRTRLIKVTSTFKLVVIGATGAIFLLYVTNIVLSFWGISIGFINEGGILGIGFSLIVVVVASLNLVLDFDYIEKQVEYGAPKYLEWYSAFAILITLVWLYLEILRLLAKLKR